MQLNLPRSPGAALRWGPHDEAFGTNGAGGQIGFADPISRIGVGFLRSRLCESSPTGGMLVDALYQCLAP